MMQRLFHKSKWSAWSPSVVTMMCEDMVGSAVGV